MNITCINGVTALQGMQKSIAKGDDSAWSVYKSMYLDAIDDLQDDLGISEEDAKEVLKGAMNNA